MTLEFTTGDILAADVEALVNTVNCVGIMGRGVARQFKDAFPDNFRAYEAACRRHDLQPGRMFVFETGALTNPKFIINFPTKRHWRGKSRIEDIDAGLRSLAVEIRARSIQSIAIPPLGSGLGGLKWTDVRPRIEATLRDCPDVRVIVFEPSGSPIGRPSKVVPKMTPGRAALVTLMDRYLGGLLDPFISLLEVHKLMYFLQEAGEDLNLRYAKAPYGPYAENLRHVLHAIEGHLVSGYTDGGDDPDKPLKLVPGAVTDARQFLSERHETVERIERVGRLAEGFETSTGLELLATVHWVAAYENAHDLESACARVHAWSDRKRRFTPRQIALAFTVLRNQGWLPNGRDDAATPPRSAA